MTEQKDREDILYLAKLAEQCDRYDEMKDYLKTATKLNMGTEPPVDERNLFSVAYKNSISHRRTSHRMLKAAEQKLINSQPEERDGSITIGTLNNYRLSVEKEIRELCNEVLHLIDEYSLPFCSSAEGKTFYFKMRGDYHRYLAEISGASEDKENSLTAYKAANDIAAQELKATDPTRLGLALNFSVFYYEVLNSSDRACRLAKAAFDEAISDLDKLNETDYKDSTLIMQLLRNNLTLWTATEHDEQIEEQEDNDTKHHSVTNRKRSEFDNLD